MSEQIRQRADIINTQVITRDRAKRLGVVKEILVDIDRREVVAFGLRDSLLPAPGGLIRYMLLDVIEQLGDAILVANDDIITDIDSEAYTTLTNCEVVTETGDLLGKVRGYRFDVTNGKLTSIIIASIGIPLIPDQVVSTYELSIDEVISSGPNRLIVFEGAEERLTQLSVGFLERLGLSKSLNEDDYYKPTVIAPSNQLPAGTPVTPPPRVKRPETPVPVVNQRPDNQWEEELEPITPPTPKVREAKYYQVEEEITPNPPIKVREVDYWGEEEELEEERPMINIPQKVKQVEYQEEDF